MELKLGPTRTGKKLNQFETCPGGKSCQLIFQFMPFNAAYLFDFIPTYLLTSILYKKSL